jgi:hypothetical protein
MNQTHEKTEEAVRELTMHEKLAVSGGEAPNPKPTQDPFPNPVDPNPGIPC